MFGSIFGLLLVILQIAAPGAVAGADDPRAEEIFEVAAQWMPEEATMVVATTIDWRFDDLRQVVVPWLNPDAEPGSLGSIEGLSTDLKSVIKEHVGVDITAIDAAAVSFDDDFLSAVLIGDIELPEDLTEVEVNDKRAYELVETSPVGPMGTELVPEIYYGFPVQDPKPMLVVTTDLDGLARIDAARDAEEDASLATSESGRALSALFEEAAGASMIAATTSEGAASEEETLAADIGIEAAVLRIADGVGVTIIDDDPETLDTIAAQVEQGMSMMRGELEYTVQHEDFFDLTERMGVLYAYHNLEALVAQLEPRRDETSISYEVRLAEDLFEYLPLMMLGSALPWIFLM